MDEIMTITAAPSVQIRPHKFAHVKMGARVRLDYGCEHGEAFGIVYGRIYSRFGDSLRIKLDDFTFTTIEGFTTTGIGAYLVIETPIDILKNQIRAEETQTLVDALMLIGGGYVSEDQRMVRACLLDIYQERNGEEATLELSDQIGL